MTEGWRGERERDRKQHMDIERDTVHDQENKLCILLYYTNTHNKCALINPYGSTVQTQADWRKWLCNIKTTLGSVSSLWTLCASTTWALYSSPIQSICSLLFHPLVWSLSLLSLHVICVIVLFVLFSGYRKAVGNKTHTHKLMCVMHSEQAVEISQCRRHDGLLTMST